MCKDQVRSDQIGGWIMSTSQPKTGTTVRLKLDSLARLSFGDAELRAVVRRSPRYRHGALGCWWIYSKAACMELGETLHCSWGWMGSVAERGEGCGYVMRSWVDRPVDDFGESKKCCAGSTGGLGLQLADKRWGRMQRGSDAHDHGHGDGDGDAAADGAAENAKERRSDEWSMLGPESSGKTFLGNPRPRSRRLLRFYRCFTSAA